MAGNRLNPKTQSTTIIHKNKKRYDRKKKGIELMDFQASFYKYI